MQQKQQKSIDNVSIRTYNVYRRNTLGIFERRKKTMKEERTRTEPELQAEKTGKDQIEEWKKDGEDFAELLKDMTEEEKREVKGILIGMKIARDRPLTA
jgi:hypothetical protein